VAESRTLGLDEFLAARLDEDEAAAKLAAREGGTWTQDDPERHPGSISSLGGPVVYDEDAPDENQAPHIARHDPARVLREVAAGRKRLAEHEHSPNPYGALDYGPDPGFGCKTCHVVHDEYYNGGWCQTLRIDAEVFSDHPDYAAKWAPDDLSAVS